MAAKGTAGASYVSAAVLAAITLFVFYTLRDYGPGSAVRRFHDDLKSKNYLDLQRICSERIDNNPYVGTLAATLEGLDEAGAVSTIVSEDRSAKEVDVLVFYKMSNGAEFFVWVVKNDGGIWQIDPEETIKANRGLGGNIQ